MPTSILDQGLAEVKAQAFTVGGTFDGKKVSGGVTYDRKWSNGWGITAYAKAFWNDQSVLAHSGIEAGGKITKTF